MAALQLSALARLPSTRSRKDELSGAKGALLRSSFLCGQPHKLSLPQQSLGAPVRSLRPKSVIVLAAAGADGLPVLNELPLYSYISQQGRITPAIEPGTQATVFAVLDKNKKVQYVGFSKDIRNSLRTLMGRRPEFCYYYKLFHLSTLDQQKMLDIRSQWFAELGVPPAGNTDPVQRGMWERPADAGSISERGKAAAALSKAKTLQQMMVDRGLKEEMEYDPKLIGEGKCDVLPSLAQSAEELAAEAAAAEASALRQVAVRETAPSGEAVEFEVLLEQKVKTNGGWMYDILVTKDEKETRHRIICSRQYAEASGLQEDQFLVRVVAFLLHKKIPRQTEGVLTSDQFPINYFAVSEVAQKFGAEFADWFGTALPDSYWRFNRIHSYGNETAPVSTPEDLARLAAPRQ